VFKGGIGIFLHSSVQNEVNGNSVTDATSGITLEFSDENIIDGNIIFGGFIGIRLDDSTENTVRKNVVKDCEQLALSFWRTAAQNLFYINSFINNTRNVAEPTQWSPAVPINIWDNGTVGNYWGDYNGTDTNGDDIGDTPYVIDENNQDNYPLTEPHAIPEFPPWAPMLIVVLAVAAIYRRSLNKKNQRKFK
jgi:parallel beta-helix repeat protein